MMRWLVIALVMIVAVLIIVVGVGAALPRDHVAAARATIPAPRSAVWDVLTDVESFPSWRQDVDGVTVLEPERRWRERAGSDVITYERIAAEPPARLVTRIADEGLPFGGTWTWALEEAGPATVVTITERGTVSNPIFRFVSRYLLGHHAGVENVLRSLGRRFGREVEPQRVTPPTPVAGY